ncbi:MAG: DUF2784 domain-containing protein [Phycisphaerales bacterium]|nr:DUF2784 domain-containing protein [Phycisphaerales bacterium]
MGYRLLADLVVILHLAFLLFTVLGGLLVFRWRCFPWIHLPAAIWGGFVEVTGRVCPLTVLENWLRRAGGGSGYERDFIDRYVVPIVYPPGLTREIQLALGAFLVMVNGAIYVIAWRCRTRVERTTL